MPDSYIEKKVYYHDTDSGGAVYYAGYLKYLEEGRSEYCYSRGIDLKALGRSGTYFVVAHTEVDYKSPARYFDILKVRTQVEKTGTASIHFRQKISKANLSVLDSKTVWVCVGEDFKPKAIPEEIKKSMQIC